MNTAVYALAASLRFCVFALLSTLLACSSSESPLASAAGGGGVAGAFAPKPPGNGAGAGAGRGAAPVLPVAGAPSQAVPSSPIGAGGAAAGAAVPKPNDSAAAIEQLRTHLAMPRAGRPELAQQAFAKVALIKSDAELAGKLLWEDFAAMVRETRAGEDGATEKQAKGFKLDGHELRYYLAVRGQAPASGRSLIISMHGGGEGAPDVNDSQWDNQIALCEGYMPKDAVWVAPRAPSNTWNMWFTEEIDALFEHLITSMIVFQGIDPNKVYINGYSAGGDGVYQIGPRMADHWAGASMSAGHPNTASPLNLRNLAFAIHVGGDDTAFDRNKKGQEWGQMLEALAAADPGGYPNQWQVHAGKGHWMDLEDAVAIEFMQGFKRDPVPANVVWRQAEQLRTRMYWLAVAKEAASTGAVLRASYAGSTVSIKEATNVSKLTVRLSDAMMNLDAPVRIEASGRELFAGVATRTIDVLSRTLQERGDPAATFSAEVEVTPR